MGLLQLGSFVFDMDDLPDKMEMGGQQLTATYQYPGGIKDIQTFGSFYDPITMQGTFNYTAEAKAAAIDKMYQSGGLYTFKVGNYKSLLVIITKFKPVYRSSIAMDYTIELEPLRDAPASPPPAKKTTSSSVVAHATSTASKAVTQPPKTNKPAPQRVYTVVKGDSLWLIAKKYYGSGTQYPKIMTANKLKSSLLKPGQKLVIP